MEESAAKKVHPRNLICRLCCEAIESRHLIRVFGRASKKEGSKEDLSSKIRNVCGIDITESDSLSTLICRKCDGFVSKASEVYANANTAGTTAFSEALCRALPIV